MYTTRVSYHLRAPRSAVYQAFLDADAIAKWRVPVGMSSRVHEFEAREGGVAVDGTDVLIVREGIPDKVPAADNETGTRMALANLAKLGEAR